MINIFIASMRGKSLSSHTIDRNNFFDVVRLFSALLVMYAHSYHIFGLGADPLSHYLSKYTGTVAVLIFFTISGYFIIESAIKRSFVQFLAARVLRIFPSANHMQYSNMLRHFYVFLDQIGISYVKEIKDYITINSTLLDIKFTHFKHF